MNTATKVGIAAVGVFAVVTGAAYLLLLREKTAKADETKPPTGGGTATPPPGNTTATISLSDLGFFVLKPGNMGTLRVKHPQLIGASLDGGEAVSFESSDPSVWGFGGEPVAGYTSLVAPTGSAGATKVKVVWKQSQESGGGEVTTEFTVVAEE